MLAAMLLINVPLIIWNLCFNLPLSIRHNDIVGISLSAFAVCLSGVAITLGFLA